MSHEVLIERDVMVAMRDGVQLATDVYRPSTLVPCPVLLHRTPYDKTSGYTYRLVLNPVEAVDRGYVVVVQDCRGRFASEGEWTPFVHEMDDGLDTLEWVAKQLWSNGRVAPYGSSGVGISALAAAVTGHQSVKCCAVYMTALNVHEGMIYSGGAFEVGNALHWVRSLASNRLARMPSSDPEKPELARRLRELNLQLPEPVWRLPLDSDNSFPMPLAPFYRDWMSHPAYDGYWASFDLGTHVSRIPGPVLHISGWYDNLLRGHLDLNELLRQHPDETVRRESRLMLGPWSHASYYTQQPTYAGDRNFGPDAVSGPPYISLLFFKWFDRWLKDGGELPFEGGVRFYMMGENRWRESRSWPPVHTVSELYLHSAGHANTSAGDGWLGSVVPSREPPDVYHYDPMNPVPSVGGRTLHNEFGEISGVRNQKVVERRPDVLVYTSSLLDQDVAIAGPVRVRLHVASSCEDTDFTAKLVDVETSGYCVNIAEGILRARYRLGRDHECFLEPGKAAEIDIDCWDVAHIFRAGHRIRLEVSSSNFPRFDRNLNSRVRPAQGGLDDVRQATQTIFHDQDHPSRLELPVIGDDG